MKNKITEKLTTGLTGYTFSFQRIAKLQQEEKEYCISKIHKDLKTACYILFQKHFYNYDVITTCQNCNKDLKWGQIKTKSNFCGPKCGQCKEVIKKRKETLLKNHGTLNIYKIAEERIIARNQKLYGVDHYTQSEDFKEKQKKTHLKKYGVENISYSKESHELRKIKYKNKTGYQHPSQNPEVISKKRKSRRENFDNYYILNDIKQFLKKDSINSCEIANICSLTGMSGSHFYKLLKDQDVRLEDNNQQAKEKELISWLNSVNEQFHVIEKERTILYPQEIDIYIPGLKLGIEFNGDYWHQVECKQKVITKDYHVLKTEKCEQQGVRLIHIWEHQWDNSQEFCKKIIKSYLEGRTPLELFKGESKLPRDYFQTLDFSNYTIEEPLEETVNGFPVYKTGHLIINN